MNDLVAETERGGRRKNQRLKRNGSEEGKSELTDAELRLRHRKLTFEARVEKTGNVASVLESRRPGRATQRSRSDLDAT